MPRYEYKLVPAPDRATKHRGLKGAASFAATLETVMNTLGAEGWHYLRADTLPQEERSGLASRTTTYRNLLVFQRELPAQAGQTAPVPAVRNEAEDEAGLDAEQVFNVFADPDAAADGAADTGIDTGTGTGTGNAPRDGRGDAPAPPPGQPARKG